MAMALVGTWRKTSFKRFLAFIVHTGNGILPLSSEDSTPCRNSPGATPDTQYSLGGTKLPSEASGGP